MKQETKQRIHYIYSIVLSAVLVICSFLLMAACLQIFLSGGEQIYTPEKVAAAFRPISIPVYICVAMILGSFLLRVILHRDYVEPPMRNQPAMALRRMRKRRDLAAGSPELQAAVRKQRQLRKTLYGICGGVCAICAAVFLVYALNVTHFHQSQINESMIQAMWVLLPCLSLAAAVGLFVTYRSRASMLVESELLKQCPKASAPLPLKTMPAYIPRILKTALVILAVGLLIYGLVSGGTADVLTKAKNICTECVGLG